MLWRPSVQSIRPLASGLWWAWLHAAVGWDLQGLR